MLVRVIAQPLFCTFGFHVPPPHRNPPGPVVATCPCCGKVKYYYGLSLHGMGTYPQLALPAFPKVLGPVSATYA
jgi:hypothetical protein